MHVDLTLPIIDLKDENDIFTTKHFPITFDTTEDKENCIDYQRQYTILVKSAYNRLMEGMKHDDTYHYLSTLKGIQDLDTRFYENAILDAKALIEALKDKFKEAKKINKSLIYADFIKQKENIVRFRNDNFTKRYKNIISKDVFKENKYLPFTNYGEKAEKGNRKFYIDLDNNKVVLKLSKNKHINLNLPKLKTKLYKDLCMLEELMENNQIAVTFKLDKNELYISYKPIIQQKIYLKDNRILAFDLNPNYIGYSILEFNGIDFTIIKADCIELKEINDGNTNQKSNGLIKVSKQLIQVMKSYSVGNIAIDDVSISSKDYGKGAALNSCLNKWNRNIIVNNIKKRCRIEGMKVYLVNPKYSTTIGNLMYDYFDPINSSIEIGRRGYLYNKLGMEDLLYPDLTLKNEWIQRKDEAGICFKSWVEIHNWLKNTNLRYRVLLPEKETVFRRKRIKNINFIQFII